MNDSSRYSVEPSSNSRRTVAWRWLIPSALAALLLLLFGGTSTLALAGPPPTTVHGIYDKDIAAIIAQVTTQALEYDLNGLTGERPVVVGGKTYTIKTRKTFDPQAMSKATQYAYEQFASYGLNVAYHNYNWRPGSSFLDHELRGRGTIAARNVVAEKPGLVHPEQIYLLTAHVDDMPTGIRAPGADDNASGSVAVLTAARLLAPHDFAYTIRFVLFTGEEQGLHGSAAYAADVAAREEDIRGVINLDMIAHDSDPEPIIDLYATTDVPASLVLMRTWTRMIGAYDLDVTPACSDNPMALPASDQGSFLSWGYPVMLVIEDMDDFNPNYHKGSDVVANLDLDYYTDITRAAVATIAHLAIPVH